MTICLVLNAFSLSLQWVCSTLILLKIRQVEKKIERNKLNKDSAARFRRQAKGRPFFYPSIFCTISSILYLVKPFLPQPDLQESSVSDGFLSINNIHFILLHAVRSNFPIKILGF